MKKILFYSLLFCFALINIFGSCEEDIEERNKRFKASKNYFEKCSIYENVDSSYTQISVYTGEIKGHKYRYHLFEGKNKSQMEVEHLIDECKACKKTK